ncbi:MAG: prepilin-type N-terminal cleavage/methylation domain-containing protein [Elusimicrobia bacterium]|nr:prepilin-type N-terminal cleavage/methylation domain-containing protein [Elusimicrobiota bacterium]
MRRSIRLGASRGFTLVELLIAVALSLIVLMGVVSMAAWMISRQYEGIRKGEVTGAVLYSLGRMNKELADGTYLAQPAGADRVIRGCSNWSTMLSPPGRLDPNPNTPVTAFYYCYAPAECGGEAGNSLLRYWHDSECPNAAPVSRCGEAPGSGWSGPELMLMGCFYPATSNPFRRANDVAGVAMNFSVGRTTPTFVVNTRISMNKSYNNPSD